MQKTWPKTILVILILATGLMWLVGGAMNGVLSPAATTVSAITFLCLFSFAALSSLLATHRREVRMDDLKLRREQRLAEIEASGFQATRKFIGSGRMLAVDENGGQWFLMNHLCNPEQAAVHKLASISEMKHERARNIVDDDCPLILPSGKPMDAKTRQEYCRSTGLAIYLADGGVTFANCYKTPRDAGIILTYMTPLIDRWKQLEQP